MYASQVSQVLTFSSSESQVIAVFYVSDTCIQTPQFINVALSTSDDAVNLAVPVVQLQLVEEGS